MGTPLARIMSEREVSPRRLSALADLNLVTVYRAIRGENLKLDTLRRIAAALDVDVARLIGTDE
jgi:predicted transcriptional regulator